MSTTLGAFQASFFDALLAEPGEIGDAPFARQPGFAVYRNTVMTGCIEALGANYPTVRALIGEDRFRALARAFVRSDPPRDGVMASYGARFPEALGSRFHDDTAVPVVAIAALDRAWTESHLAADAALLEPGSLVALAAEHFAAARLVPHPAARWLVLDATPAFSWWRAQREGRSRDDGGADDQCALLTRPDGAVAWTAIDPAGAAFLDACARGLVVADALDAAARAEPDNEVGRWLPALMHARAFTRIDAGIAGEHA